MSLGRNSTPALVNAFSIAASVLVRESTLLFSRRVTALRDTIALSASCCCDQPRSARAARICRGVIMITTIDSGTIFRHSKAKNTPCKDIYNSLEWTRCDFCAHAGLSGMGAGRPPRMDYACNGGGIIGHLPGGERSECARLARTFRVRGLPLIM